MRYLNFESPTDWIRCDRAVMPCVFNEAPKMQSTIYTCIRSCTILHTKRRGPSLFRAIIFANAHNTPRYSLSLVLLPSSSSSLSFIVVPLPLWRKTSEDHHDEQMNAKLFFRAYAFEATGPYVEQLMHPLSFPSAQVKFCASIITTSHLSASARALKCTVNGDTAHRQHRHGISTCGRTTRKDAVFFSRLAWQFARIALMEFGCMCRLRMQSPSMHITCVVVGWILRVLHHAVCAANT